MFNSRLLSNLITITARPDLMIAVLLIAVVFMMILPMPTLLVDILIGTNLAFAITLLMVGVYISTPLEFLAFPAVLLITTIFRLALSITTTRLILLEGDAGKIIETFGNFVVGGNLVVGLVIFLIITIVQFLVITKGSERVAEVSARFSLDAMPGKQMSIDSDMRAGFIDMDEARRRRQLVEKDSALFGSMDGAMKFVKGDAIAGLVIIIVNILGGITIGTVQGGLTASEALEIYSILTIGDGLISQIPALIISVCAGIIVTRVTSEDSKDLGTDIVHQILNQPSALMIGGVIMAGFSMIPGFPTGVFLALAAAASGGGYMLQRASGKQAAATDSTGSNLSMLSTDGRNIMKTSETEEDFTITVPIIIDIYAGCEKILDVKGLNAEIVNIRKALYMDLGVPFPGIHLRFSPNQEEDNYAILLQETPISKGTLRSGNVMVLGQREQLEILDVPFERSDSFIQDREMVWVLDEYIDVLDRTRISYMQLPRVLTYHLSFILKKYADEFLGIQETKYLMSQMEDKYSELVKEVQRMLPIQKVAEIFQRLVSEDISIRNLRKILEALVEWAQKEKDTVLLTEYVRSSLKRYISYKYSSGQNILPAYLLDQDVEDTIRNGIRQTSAGSYLALDPSMTAKIVQNIKTAVGDIYANTYKPVLITSMDIRRYVRKMIEMELYGLPVLSYQELTSDITVQPLARIDMY
ncbi:MAG: type III secretion system export apparatus subunit SctV [Gammaproteobacteria bacterium]